MDHTSDLEQVIYIKEDPELLLNDDSDLQVERIVIKAEPELFPVNLPSTSWGPEERTVHIKEEEQLHIKEECELLINYEFDVTVGSEWMVCFHCGHMSVSLGRLRKHIVWRHIRTVPPQLDVRSTSEDNNASSWNRNVQKRFQCSFCNYSCRKPSHLKTHMLIHKGEKPFHCTLCSYSCRQSVDLKKHMLIHTGEKPFQCALCSYKCRQSGNFKRHMLIHTGEKPFQCTLCSYSFRVSSHLKRHMLIHKGERPFQCKSCSYSFRESGTLKRHMLKHACRPGDLITQKLLVRY